MGTGHSVCLSRKNGLQNWFNLQKIMFYHIHRLFSKPGNSFIFNCSCSPGYNCLEDEISQENIAFIICISISLRNSDYLCLGSVDHSHSAVIECHLQPILLYC